MEEKLLWVSLVSGACAVAFRLFFKKEERLNRAVLTSAAHGLWWGVVGVLAAWLYSSYKERPDLMAVLMVGLGLGGAALGVLWGFVKGGDRTKAERILRDDMEWADTGFSSILLAACIMYVFVQAFKIPSSSMEKTLLIGDHLFVNKLIYGVRIPFTEKRLFTIRDVKRGDIVVFRFPSQDVSAPHYGKDFIKRAIGLPGDKVEIRDKRVYVNGEEADRSFTNFADPGIKPAVDPPPPPDLFQKAWLRGMIGDDFRDNFGPVTVPEGHYFVLGDNRDRSYDGRFWGPMPKKFLKGKAWVIYWPFNRMRVIR